MKLVKIINGTYGYKAPGERYITPVKAGDPPIEVSDEKAARLIRLRVAKEVDAAADETGQEDKLANYGEKAPEEKPYSVEIGAKKLRELMKDAGLPFKAGMSKVDMVAALDGYYDKAEDDGEGPPDLGAEDPVV